MESPISEQTPLVPDGGPGVASLRDLFGKPPDEATPTSPDIEKHPSNYSYLAPISTKHKQLRRQTASCGVPSKATITSTLIGSTIFLIYHIVFCLAQAATIVRPHAEYPSTGLLAKTAALGLLTAGPIFVYELSPAIPAIYPASDLFLAPFLADIAIKIDAALYKHDLHNNDAAFLSTFVAVCSFGLVISGVMCIAAGRYKLANLGAYLPYSVLCGFFTTIGILMWTLGFSVDTGQKIGEVLTSNDPEMIKTAAIHHAPSLCIGMIMHMAGRAHPLWVVTLVIMTGIGSYGVMWITGISLQQAQELNWFFSVKDLVQHDKSIDEHYGPPYPLGVWFSVARGDVIWDAAFAALEPVLALAFLYLIRCSLHAAALKKNAPLVTRKAPEELTSPSHGSREDQVYERVPSIGLGEILEKGYGYSQLFAAIFGGITVAPAVAASLTLFQLGAETAPPQYGSIVLVVLFYATDFSFVQYIPKPAFSCLMVLAGFDMCRTWIIGSYMKSKDKAEWLVAPILVVLSFAVGILNAIFIGIAISTFIFAANFYHAGSVRFVGSGLTLRSTVERGVAETQWLDQNADLIQILVLQNYLFFGNAQSVLTYISTMFEEELDSNLPLPPIPQCVILDFTIVTGMDTSAVDLFGEVLQLCKDHKCRLHMAGMSPNLKSRLLYAGFKPTTEKRWLAFRLDLESALGKAEDSLLFHVFHLKDKVNEEAMLRSRSRTFSNVEDGFLYALKKIDEQHGLRTLNDLSQLTEYTSPIELKAGEALDRDRSTNGLGIYFVETGHLTIERDYTFSASSTSSSPFTTDQDNPPDSILSLGHLNARTSVLGLQIAKWKEKHGKGAEISEQSFRFSQVGQGWIIGGVEAANGMRRQGLYVAVTATRLHFLSMDRIYQLETNNPGVAMHLYKVLSLLSTKRQEATIRQLGQFVRIMRTPTPRLRGGKSELVRLQNA